MAINVTSLTLDQSDISLLAGDSIQLVATILPIDADDTSVKWQTSDFAIANVSSTGLVTAVSNGNIIITATSNDGGFSDTCNVGVAGEFVPDVTNFNMVSSLNNESSITYTFTFDHNRLFMGGYELLYSYDESKFELAQFYADTNLRTISNRVLDSDFISVTDQLATIVYVLPFSSMNYGKAIYFKIRRVNTNNLDKSKYSSTITTYTYPSISSAYKDTIKLLVEYQYDKAVLHFNNIVTETNNTKVSSISVIKNILEEKKILSLSYPIIECAEISIGKPVVIWDYKKKSFWCGVSTTDNYIDMSTIFLPEYSHYYSDTNQPYIYNLRLFAESSSEVIISEIKDLSADKYDVVDNNILKGKIVLYKTRFNTPDSNIYSQIITPIYGVNIQETAICWRPLESSTTPMLKSVGWKNMRNSLIDSKYYNKSQWDVPFSKTTNYDIVGYIGISNCYIDVYFNNVFYKTITSDEYGSFHIYNYFPAGPTSIYVIARTADNLYFSSKSPTIILTANYIYSWFAALSTQHTAIAQQNTILNNRMSVDTTESSFVQSSYAKLAGITLTGNEPQSDFVKYIRGALNVYNNIGREQALTDLFLLFKSNITSISDIQYIPSAEFLETKTLGSTFISVPNSTASLGRKKYQYVITACTNTGQETDGSSIVIDTRYSTNLDNCKVYSAISWDFSDYADYYKVYRGEYNSSGGVGNSYLISSKVSGNIFVDVGSAYSDTTKSPPLYNVSIMENPNNIKTLNYHYMTSWENLLKKPYYFTILISMVGPDVMPQYLLSRFYDLLNNIIPSEMFYNLVVYNDTTITIFDKNLQIISSTTGLTNE